MQVSMFLGQEEPGACDKHGLNDYDGYKKVIIEKSPHC